MPTPFSNTKLLPHERVTFRSSGHELDGRRAEVCPKQTGCSQGTVLVSFDHESDTRIVHEHQLRRTATFAEIRELRAHIEYLETRLAKAEAR